MKRIFLMLTIGALALAGCGSRPGSVGGEVSSSSAVASSIASSAAASIAASSVGLPNPMVEYPTPDFSDVAGFAVKCPKTFADGAVTTETCQLIDGTIAQLNLTFWKDTKGILRVASDTEGAEISGVYTSFESVHTEDFGNGPIEISESAGGPGLMKWRRDGYVFSLFFPSAPMNFLGTVATSFLPDLTVTH